MFGEKQRRIDELQAQLDEVEPYVEIAQSLKQRVADKLSGATQADLDGALNSAIDQTEAGLLKVGLDKLIKKLPPEVLLGMYAKNIGDDTVAEAVNRLGALQQKKVVRKARLAEIAHDAERSRMLDMRNIDEGEIVTIGLWTRDTTSYHKSYHYRECSDSWGPRRTITARMRDSKTATLETLQDMWSPPLSEKQANKFQSLQDHQLVQIGTLVASAFEPVVTHGTTIAFCTEKADVAEKSYFTISHLDLGYVALDDRVLLDHPDAY